jgi:hypothetical protein
VSGKALEREAEAFFGIVGDLVTDLRFDRAHLRNLSASTGPG